MLGGFQEPCHTRTTEGPGLCLGWDEGVPMEGLACLGDSELRSWRPQVQGWAPARKPRRCGEMRMWREAAKPCHAPGMAVRAVGSTPPSKAGDCPGT